MAIKDLKEENCPILCRGVHGILSCKKLMVTHLSLFSIIYTIESDMLIGLYMQIVHGVAFSVMQSWREWLIRIYHDYTQNMAVIFKHQDAKAC